MHLLVLDTKGLVVEAGDVRNGQNIIRGQVGYLSNNMAVETWDLDRCDNRDTACVTVSQTPAGR